MLCPQLKQNLETIKTLKSELDLELLKLGKLFKELKTNNTPELINKIDNKAKAEFKKERTESINKIKSLKSKINLEIEKIEDELPTKKIEVGKEFNLKFKYRNLKEMIKAGKFDWENPDINSTNFPDLQEKGLLNQVIKLKAKIFDFKKDISGEDVLKELDKEGYRPATLTELLALAEIDPELQRQFAIVSLGSFWRDSYDERSAPCLRVGGSARKLDLGWFGGGWGASFRCLAVRKENN
jgi:hypothetical protein